MADMFSQQAIWQMLDKLRATGQDARDFGAVLAALMFLRWVDFQEAELEAVAAFEEKEYRPSLPKKFHWRNWDRNDPFELDRFLEQLAWKLVDSAGANPELLSQHFPQVALEIEKLAKYPREFVYPLIDWLAAQPFETPKDRLDLREVLDGVISKTTDKFSSSYITPKEISLFMTEMVRPKLGDKVYDPCMGTGGLLTTAYEYVRKGQKSDDDESSFVQNNGDPISVSGIDVHRETIVVALARLVLSGLNEPRIEQGNSLERSALTNSVSEGFDVVLTNPPWSMKVDPYGLDHFPIPTRDSASLFLQHALSQLSPGGRAVVVLPSSFLYRSGREMELREMLIERHTIEAIVSLPRGAFAPYTAIETCLLLIKKGGSTQTIRMVNADSLFEKAKKSKLASDPNEMAKQLARKVFSETEGVEWWDVDAESLYELDFDLTPKRRRRSELEISLDSIEDRELVRTLEDVCEILTGRSIKSQDLSDFPISEEKSDLPDPIEVANERSEILAELSRLDNDAIGQRNKIRILTEKLNALQTEDDYRDHVESFDVPYIRIRDLQNERVDRGSSWLTDEATRGLNPSWKLRYGDVLVSKSGTIGKSGIVTNGAVGGVASQGLFVLHPHEGVLDPHFLIGFLSSKEVNSWLDSNARGSAAKHLSVKAFRKLPIVVPPLQVQHRIAEQYKKFKVNVLSFSIELLTDDGDDPLSKSVNKWISSQLAILHELDTAFDDYTLLSTFEQLAQDKVINVCEECDEPYHLDYESQYIGAPEAYEDGIETSCVDCWLGVGPSSESIEELTKRNPLVPWVLEFQQALKPLDGITHIPETVGILNVLQVVQSQAESSSRKVDGHQLADDKARQLVKELCHLIADYREHVSTDVGVSAKVLHTYINKNGDIEIAFEVFNKGSVPIRKTVFRLSPDLPPIESATIAYLEPGQTYWLGFRGKLLFSEKTMDFVLSWKGRNLTNDEFKGKLEFTGEIKQKSELQDEGNAVELDFGSSPYIVGDPVKIDRADIFFGRQSLLDQIKRQIAQTGNVIILEGNRRAGKSSVLWHLEGKSVDGWLGVYCSMQELDADESQASAISTVEVFRVIATAIAKKMKSEFGSTILPDGSTIDETEKYGLVDAIEKGIPENRPFQRFREYVEIILDQLKDKGLRLLLLLDEFDKLQASVRSGATSKSVPENIRALLQSNSSLSAVLTGTKRMKRLRAEHFSVLFGLGTPYDVGSLSIESAVQLIKEPIEDVLTYSKQAIDRACFLTARQPYLLQCLCQKIFVLAAEQKNQSITIEEVNSAAKELVRDNGHFVDLFNYAGSELRRLILALCHKEAESIDPLKFKVIQEKLDQQGIAIQEDDLSQHLEWLLDYELLSYSAGDSTYSVGVPLLGDWLDLYLDYSALLGKTLIEIEDTNEFSD